jgi:hypothetical protein
MPDALFKEGYDQLVTKLGTITGLTVFNDPRNINVPCAIVEAPSIEMASNVVADMEFRVVIVGMGTGDNRTLDQLLDLADLIREAEIGLNTARPTTVSYGGADYPAYELVIRTKVAP